MSDRFESEENGTEEEKSAGQNTWVKEKGELSENGMPEEGNGTPSGQGTPEEGNGTPSGKDIPEERNGTPSGQSVPEEGNGTPSGQDTPGEKKEGLPEEETVMAGEVDERLSSYVKEHIRSGGRQRRISAFRILFFAVLITIVVFFFVDYVLMKRQVTKGWFSQSSATEENGSGNETAEEGENGTSLSEEGQTEPTLGAAGEDETSQEQDDSEKAQSGDGSSTAVSGELDETDVNSGGAVEKNETDSSAELETAADPMETVLQYLVYIEVENSEEAASLQAGEADDQALGQQSVQRMQQTGQANQSGLSEDGTETTAQGDTAEGVEQTHGTMGVIVEIGQSAIRILTDYSSVESAETLEITFHGGETAPAQVEAINSGTGLALLLVSVAELSNETLKEIRTATWGDTAEIEAGTGLTLVTAGEQTGTDESRSTSEIIVLSETTILAVSEKKQPDTVFTTYSFDTNAEGCRILADENGDVVAIGTGAESAAGYTDGQDGTATAIAYCVDDLRLYIEKMVDGGEIPYVGITGVAVTDEIKESVSLDMPYGVYVWLADTGSPAYQAGILNGDIITAINGVEITTVQEMRDAILGLEVGVEASFTLMRQGGSTYREYTIEVTPEAAEAELNIVTAN